jgi:hypothetical protein
MIWVKAAFVTVALFVGSFVFALLIHNLTH